MQSFHNVLHIHTEVANKTELLTLIKFSRNSVSYLVGIHTEVPKQKSH